MTYRFITTYIASGVSLNMAMYTGLEIESTGGVGGAGVYANFDTVIVNLGKVNAARSNNSIGVKLTSGGTVVNYHGGSIAGYLGVYISGASGTVANFGTIEGGFAGNGVYLHSGGSVTNGSTADSSALIEGDSGVSSLGAATVVNYGLLEAAGSFGDGVFLQSGGKVTNFGTVRGEYFNGVLLQAAGTVINGSTNDTDAVITGANNGVLVSGGTGSIDNLGTISSTGTAGAGVDIQTAGGAVTNGTNAVTSARIFGHIGIGLGGAGNVANFGTVLSLTDFGVDLAAGGTVVNGSVTDTKALIEGYLDGVVVSGAAGTVTNLATIAATYPAPGTPTNVYSVAGVRLDDGGSLTNGSLIDRTAQISGYYGVISQNVGGAGVAATIANFGAIAGGVLLQAGGSVTNGAPGDTTALISGGTGIDSARLATVANFGSIQGETSDGIFIDQGGAVTNGGITDTKAQIEGLVGVFVGGAAGAVTNFGVIHGIGLGTGNAGVNLFDGGSVTNGGPTDTGALIDGYSGVFGGPAAGGTTIANFATIAGTGLAGQSGVYLQAGGSVTNGSSKDAKAVIEGYGGVYATGSATLTNFGTIEGDGGTAVQFKSPGDALVVEAGSTFVGSILGGGDTLDLASGVGTLSLLAGDDTVVSGSMATTTFQNFGTVEVGPGAVFTLAGSDTVVAGQTLVDDGSLSVPGVLTVTGTLTVTGSLGGAGTVAISGGTANLDAGTSLTVADVTVSGAAKMNVNTSLAYAGKWTQSAGTLSVAASDVLTFSGSGDSFAGTMATSGEVVVSGVTATVGSAGLSLTGTGVVMLSNNAASEITGATGASTLTNASHIEGAGQLGGGSLLLVNKAGAVIESVDTIALIVNTGANTVSNAGVIESAGTGGMTIAGAVSNSGALVAGSSTLTVQGAVTGTGIGEVENGTLALRSGFTQNVTFTGGSKGTLALAGSQAYSGVISGFSTTGATFLDLQDIIFADLLPASSGYSGNTTSGILTVKDSLGHTATIRLAGNYTASVFAFSKDTGGGTMVTDPTKPPPAAAPHLAAPPLAHTAFVQAMASLADPGSARAVAWTHDHHVSPMMLAAPGLSTA